MSEAKRILIVDDEPMVATCLRDLLQSEGVCTVESAASGADGIAAVMRRRPDLVLLDITMPGLDGLKVLKRIRAFDRDIPVVMITGSANLDALSAAVKHGAFGYIPKPFNLDYVRHFVALALQCYRPTGTGG